MLPGDKTILDQNGISTLRTGLQTVPKVLITIPSLVCNFSPVGYTLAISGMVLVDRSPTGVMDMGTPSVVAKDKVSKCNENSKQK